MVQVLRLNGLIPLPIEVDPHTLGCTLDQFKKFYSQRTKGIMISYVFGTKFDSSDIIDWAQSKGLFIMEDEAESFNAPNAKLNPNVEFSTFSFSSIKTYSAFGGSISVIRNNEVLYSKMKAIQETQPKWSQRNQDINQNFQLFEENFKKFNPNDFVKQQNNKKKFKMDFQQFLFYQALQRICSQYYSRIPKKLS
ncbi:unnamed protein product [Paramecium primaurelia]|uniref:Uncharacterized protein n=1 Tax=Paramecium primaurelia TaxID=5886 RepID=A0A8S1LG65_PARPR|nr:unnamed protein product [Paramecium primaurelia]